MAKSNTFFRGMSMLLTFVIMISMLSTTVMASVPSTDVAAAHLRGKKISILGDGISTYTNYSNGTAADNSNSTIRNNKAYYTLGKHGVHYEGTWWKQVADTLNMEILVNNSWDESAVFSYWNGAMAAYESRCVQLHGNTGKNKDKEPDIILVYLGSSDFTRYPNSLGSADGIDYNSIVSKTKNGYSYAKPKNVAEAYAVMLSKMINRYPNAGIYCCTLLPRKNLSNAKMRQLEGFNNTICAIADYYGAYVVDLYKNSGITSTSSSFDRNIVNGLYPNLTGMDAITEVVVDSIVKNSPKPGDYILDKNGIDVGSVYLVYFTRRDGLHNVLYCNDNVTDAVPITKNGDKLEMSSWIDPARQLWRVVSVSENQIALKSMVSWGDYYLCLRVPYPTEKARITRQPSLLTIQKGKTPGTYTIKDGSLDCWLSYDYDHSQFSITNNKGVEVYFYKLVEA